MNKLLIVASISILLVVSCNQKKNEMVNPFFSEYSTPFNVPPFEQITNEHFMPAFEEGIKLHEAEIMAITNNTETPDFENTVLAFDQSGRFLRRVSLVFYNLNSAHTDSVKEALAREIGPRLSQHNDNIMLNEKLFQRVKMVYDSRYAPMTEGKMPYDSAQIHVIEKLYESFVRNGANLSPEDKEKLRALNEELTTLTIQFGQNLLAETNKNFMLVIDQKADLAGLPDELIASAAEAATENGLDGKWIFTLQKPSMIPFLQYAQNRGLREKLYRAYTMRGNNTNEFDNKDEISRIVQIRAERAKLFGYANHASYVIEQNMAKTPENVYKFIDQLWEKALAKAKNEAKEMQAIIDAEGGNFKLASWDWWYYAEKLRKQKYDLDEAELKPYFQLENVRNGMFWVAKQLYGIQFRKIDSIPVYHPDVEAYEVTEADGSHTGILYLDYHPRASKQVGAWCTSYRDAHYRGDTLVPPVISIVCNFTKASAETPSLLTWDEVTTLFHEFGHALHFLFVDGKYSLTAGNVPRDYVELPSQIMENFAAEPLVLNEYAKHYKTGEIIPENLVMKLEKSSQFNQGFNTVEYIAAALLDLNFHALSDKDSITDVVAYEKTAMDKIGLIEEIVPRYRTTYFGHIFSDEYYSAGYYVYLWAEVLDADAFEAFKQSGNIFNPELAAKFREFCLATSGDMEGMEAYLKFRGQEPSVAPLLVRKGLN
ncbi:MAG: M3 family metallopeptidase [Bacteroidota bacterium]|nr:MAG: M3 family metallopeptidase [Bacteroidota bacterium]